MSLYIADSGRYIADSSLCVTDNSVCTADKCFYIADSSHYIIDSSLCIADSFLYIADSSLYMCLHPYSRRVDSLWAERSGVRIPVWGGIFRTNPASYTVGTDRVSFRK